MHKLITATLLATTIAAPLMAQDYPGNRGQGDPYGRQARDQDRGRPDGRDGRPDDSRRQGQPGGGYEARPGPPPPGGGRPDLQRRDGADRRFAPEQGRGPDRGPPPGGWQGGRDRDHGRDGGRNGAWNGRGWDQRWRSDQRYDWRGYRASHRDAFRVPGYYAPGGYGYRRFQPGYRIDALFYDQRYWIDDPYAYRLPPADGPYRWVRYFDDVLLIDLRSGLVVDAIPGFFY